MGRQLIGCQDRTAQAGSWPDSPGSWEKGPDHFPRPCTPTSGCPPRRDGTAGPLVLRPPFPGARGPDSGRTQPSHQQPLLLASPPPDQVRGPGGVCLVTGLDPDHKARHWPGISREMLLAKPLWLQGPDRKPPSFSAASLPPPGRTPELTSGTAQPEVSSQTAWSSQTPGKCMGILGGAASGSGFEISLSAGAGKTRGARLGWGWGVLPGRAQQAAPAQPGAAESK